jgi:hypothetical protein
MTNTRTAQNASDRFDDRAQRAARHARRAAREPQAPTGRYAARLYVSGVGMTEAV